MVHSRYPTPVVIIEQPEKVLINEAVLWPLDELQLVVDAFLIHSDDLLQDGLHSPQRHVPQRYAVRRSSAPFSRWRRSQELVDILEQYARIESTFFQALLNRLRYLPKALKFSTVRFHQLLIILTANKEKHTFMTNSAYFARPASSSPWRTRISEVT
jgi:hypothetical protein